MNALIKFPKTGEVYPGNSEFQNKASILLGDGEERDRSCLEIIHLCEQITEIYPDAA